MAPTYKLTYFNIRGRGETTRFLFALGGQQYEDVRVEMADWPKLKPTTPNGYLPVLEVEGQTLCQSLAINRFLAKRFGLYGASDIEAAQIDMNVDTIYEAMHQLGPVFAAQPGDAQKLAGQKFHKDHVVPCFTKVQDCLKRNNGGSGYFVGSKLSLADVTLATIGDVYTHFSMGETVWDKFPMLAGLKKKVEADPKIAQWIKSRPQTPY